VKSTPNSLYGLFVGPNGSRTLAGVHKGRFSIRVELYDTSGFQFNRLVVTAPDPQSAIAVTAAVLADRRRVLGEDDPATLGAGTNLAGAYYAAGDLGRAIPLCEQVLADSVRALGEDHPETKMVRDNLAAARQQPQ